MSSTDLHTTAGPQAARGRSRWPRRLAVAALSALVLGLSAELLARLGPRPKVHQHTVWDPLLGFRMPAGSSFTCSDEAGSFPYRLNSLGFRGPELPAENSAAASGRRILLVGDSFLNAWRVREEDWVGTAIAATLSNSGTPAEAFALCCDDYGTVQELLLLRDYGRRVRPSDVVLLIFPGNDLINNTIELAGRTSISSGDYFRPYLVPGPDGELHLRHALPWLARLRRSKFFSWLEGLWLRHQDSEDVRARLSGSPVLSRQERIVAGQLPEEYLELFREPAAGSAWDAAWRTTEALLLAFREETRRLGADLLVAVIPQPFQVEPGMFLRNLNAEILKNGGIPLDRQLDWNLPETRLEAFLHRAGFRHVLLLGPLREEMAETQAPLYQTNGHLNGRGHTLMGELIASHLDPAAGDVCFRPSAGDKPPVVRKRPIEIDFLARPRRELFGSGWLDWRAKTAQEPGGWPLGSRGILLTPAGRGQVTLRGSLAKRDDFPVQVSVSRDGGGEIARESFAAPGEFRISFPAETPQGNKLWVPVALAVQGASGSAAEAEERPRLFLSGVSFEPRSPSAARRATR